MPSTIETRAGGAPDESIKAPVVAATTANITLSGEQTIDTVPVVTGDRVLVKDQTASAENGIYVVATGAWVRATDWNANDDLISGILVLDTNNSILYAGTYTGDFEIDVTAVSFAAPTAVLPAAGSFTSLSVVTDITTGSISVGSLADVGVLIASGNIITGGNIVLSELADHASTPSPGSGILWVRSSDSALIFTDGDTGTDNNLLAAGATPGGADTEVQYNNGGAFGSIPELTYNDALGSLLLTANATATPLFIVGDAITSSTQPSFRIEASNNSFTGDVASILNASTNSSSTILRLTNRTSGAQFLELQDTFVGTLVRWKNNGAIGVYPGSSTAADGDVLAWNDTSNEIEFRTPQAVQTVHHGRVSATSGSGTVDGPSGFTYNWSATGVCTITHNLGTTNYSKLGMATQQGTNCTADNALTNSVLFRTENLSGTLISRPFDFIITPD